MAKLVLLTDREMIWKTLGERFNSNPFEKSATEMLQNSRDAGATEVNVFLGRKPGDRLFHLIFRDNGCGMSTEVFLNKFLCLGARTLSAQDGRTGGNGIAKAVILFNKEVVDFSIRSTANGRRFYVTRKALLAEEELVDEPAPRSPSGVVFDITYQEDAWINVRDVREVLECANVPGCKIVFNDEALSFRGQSSKLHSDLAGYPVYKTDIQGGRVVILSNGNPQFKEWYAPTGPMFILDLKSTFEDFTPTREKIINSAMNEGYRKLYDRLTFERENPLTAEAPDQKVERKIAYNLREDKAVSSSSWKLDSTPEGTKTANLLGEIIPNRGVIFEDYSGGEPWHPEKSAHFQKVLMLMDRYIEVFERIYQNGLMIQNIGIMRGHNGMARFDVRNHVFVETTRLDEDFGVLSRQLLNHLVHELSHNWETSHNERFTAREGQLQEVVAKHYGEFIKARREVRRLVSRMSKVTLSGGKAADREALLSLIREGEDEAAVEELASTLGIKVVW